MLLRIQILSTGEFLYLSDKALTVDIVSSLFQTNGDFIGSKSYPGTMPLEPNRAFIQNAHLINSDPGLRTFYVRVWLGSTPWKVARLNFVIQGKDISYTLLIDASVIANKLKETNLNGLYGPDETNLYFPTTAEYKAYLTATVTAAPGKYPMVFFPFKNEGAYKTINPDNYADYPDIAFPVNQYMNDWAIDETGAGSFVIDDYSGPVKQTQIPYFSLPYVITRIIKFMGYLPTGTWLAQETSLRILVGSNIPTFAPLIIADLNFFMPAIKLDVVLTEIRSRFGLIIDFNDFDGTCFVESISNLVNSPEVVDLRDCMLADSFEEVSTTLKAYTITQGIDDKDKAFGEEEKANLPVLTVGDTTGAVETTNITLTGVATKMIIEVSPASASGSNWRVPNINMPIYGIPPLNQISALAYDQERNFKLRFLYYHGMQKNDAGFLYPYASSDNLNINNKPITAYTLALNNTGSAALEVGKYYNIIKNSKPFQQGLKLTVQQFFSINARTRILLKDFNQATVVCLLDKISADMSTGDHILAKANLYPIYYPVNTAPVDTTPPAGTIPPYDNGTVYIRRVFRNVHLYEQTLPPPPLRAVQQDIWFEFYADEDMTTPKNVTDLSVNLKQTINSSVNPPQVAIINYECTSTTNELLIHANATSSVTQGTTQSYTYVLVPNSLYHIIT